MCGFCYFQEARNYVGVEDIIDSLQDDVTDIKKQAELAHLYITSLADPQEAIACLQLKFNQVKEELAQTKEELVKAQEELKSRKNGKCMCFTLICILQIH